MEEAVVEMKYDANKAPLGKLTSDQIKAGYLALKRIDDLVESDKFAMKDLLQACNDFYTRWGAYKSTQGILQIHNHHSNQCLIRLRCTQKTVGLKKKKKK